MAFCWENGPAGCGDTKEAPQMPSCWWSHRLQGPHRPQKQEISFPGLDGDPSYTDLAPEAPPLTTSPSLAASSGSLLISEALPSKALQPSSIKPLWRHYLAIAPDHILGLNPTTFPHRSTCLIPALSTDHTNL